MSFCHFLISQEHNKTMPVWNLPALHNLPLNDDQALRILEGPLPANQSDDRFSMKAVWETSELKKKKQRSVVKGNGLSDRIILH